MKYNLRQGITLIDMGEEILLSVSEDKILKLSDTSKTIFESALKAREISDIVTEVCAKYQVDIDVVELKNDIVKCLDMLVQNGILSIEDE